VKNKLLGLFEKEEHTSLTPECRKLISSTLSIVRAAFHDHSYVLENGKPKFELDEEGNAVYFLGSGPGRNNLGVRHAFEECFLGKPHSSLQKLLDQAPATNPTTPLPALLACRFCREEFTHDSSSWANHHKTCFRQRKHLWAPLRSNTHDGKVLDKLSKVMALNGNQSDIFCLVTDRKGRSTVL
jgi:hypothetical protein